MRRIMLYTLFTFALIGTMSVIMSPKTWLENNDGGSSDGAIIIPLKAGDISERLNFQLDTLGNSYVDNFRSYITNLHYNGFEFYVQTKKFMKKIFVGGLDQGNALESYIKEKIESKKTPEEVHAMINDLTVPEHVKEQLRNIAEISYKREGMIYYIEGR